MQSSWHGSWACPPPAPLRLPRRRRRRELGDFRRPKLRAAADSAVRLAPLRPRAGPAQTPAHTERAHGAGPRVEAGPRCAAGGRDRRRFAARRISAGLRPIPGRFRMRRLHPFGLTSGGARASPRSGAGSEDRLDSAPTCGRESRAGADADPSCGRRRDTYRLRARSVASLHRRRLGRLDTRLATLELHGARPRPAAETAERLFEPASTSSTAVACRVQRITLTYGRAESFGASARPSSAMMAVPSASRDLARRQPHRARRADDRRHRAQTRCVCSCCWTVTPAVPWPGRCACDRTPQAHRRPPGRRAARPGAIRRPARAPRDRLRRHRCERVENGSFRRCAGHCGPLFGKSNQLRRSPTGPNGTSADSVNAATGSRTPIGAVVAGGDRAGPRSVSA